MNEKRTVEILWTGGFDSTYRIVCLSRLDIAIQPYYISDNRKSEAYELGAINNITQKLCARPETKAEFKTLIIIGKEIRAEDSAVSAAYNRMLNKSFFGSQYNWLAVFARQHKGIELSIHEDDKAIIMINKYGRLKSIHDDCLGNYYILDTENSEEDMVTLFESYHFPLADMKKTEMREYYINNGYKDIMDMTWFCFTPINGKPCGKCNPCRYTIEEGMKERFTKRALLRYHLHKPIRYFNHTVSSVAALFSGKGANNS